MNNLLDTHVFIWFVNGEEKLSSNAKKQIENPSATNYLSIVSLWEIAIKISLGKLELKTPFSDILYQLKVNGLQLLPVTFHDTLTVSNLPFHHGDPFDRLLIAQCITNNISLISKDSILQKYSISQIW